MSKNSWVREDLKSVMKAVLRRYGKDALDIGDCRIIGNQINMGPKTIAKIFSVGEYKLGIRGPDFKTVNRLAYFALGLEEKDLNGFEEGGFVNYIKKLLDPVGPEKEGKNDNDLLSKLDAGYRETGRLKKTKHGDFKLYTKYRANSYPKDLNRVRATVPKGMTGRVNEVSEVFDFFNQKDQPLLVNGLGGVGKTTLAKFLINQFRGRFGHVAWLDISPERGIYESVSINVDLFHNLGLISELESISQQLDYSEKAFALAMNGLKQVGRLEPELPNLLVMDNIDEEVENLDLLDYLNLGNDWKILFTSRYQSESITNYELGVLKSEDARTLFLKHYTWSIDNILIDRILEEIEYNTLLIELVAKGAQQRRLTLPETLDTLKKKALQSLDDTPEGIRFFRNKNKKEKKIFSFLLTIFDESVLNNKNKWILSQFAVLPGGTYPFQLGPFSLRQFLEIDSVDKKSEISLSLYQTVKAGWLGLEEKSDYRMHRLIKEVLLYKLNPGVLACYDLINALNKRLDYYKVTPDTPHIHALEVTRCVKDESREFAEMMDNLGLVLHRLMQNAQAFNIQKRVLEMRLNLDNVSADDLSDSYNALSLLYKDMGEYEKALKYAYKVKEITETIGSDYDKGIAYLNLSLVYRCMSGKEEDAYRYQSLAVSKAKNVEDPDFELIIYNGMGNMEYRKREFECALKSFQKSLKIREAQGDKIWLAEAYCNVATTLIELKRYNEALTLLLKALKVEEELIGQSSGVADTYRSLAMCYFGLKDCAVALHWINKSLDMYAKLTIYEPQKLEWTKNWKRRIEKAMNSEID